MKNKKLFAILTLVCFMFTLMPVAAFAGVDDQVLLNGKDSLKVKDNVAITATVEGAVTGSTYYFFAVAEGAADDDSVVAGDVEYISAAAEASADLSALTAGKYDVYAVAASSALTTDLGKVAGSTAKVNLMLEDAGLLDGFATLTVVATDDVYTLTVNAAAATGDDAANGYEYVINGVASNNGWKAAEYTVKVVDDANKNVRDAEVKYTTNSGYIDVVAVDEVTDRLGEANFKLAATKAGTYKVTVAYEDAKIDIKVVVSEATVADVKVVAEPRTPNALDNAVNKYTGIAFDLTDANGVVLEAGQVDFNDVEVELISAPADSNLVDEVFGLQWDASENEAWVLDAADGVIFDEEGTYEFKVTLKNGASATAKMTVKEFDEPVSMMLIMKDNTIVAGNNGGVAVKRIVMMDANHVAKPVYAGGMDMNYTDFEVVVNGKAAAGVSTVSVPVPNTNTVLTNYVVNTKTDAALDVEKQVGTTITVMAINEEYGLTATATLKVVNAAEAIEFAETEANVAENNKLAINAVDADGNVVTGIFAGAEVNAYVLDAPTNAVYSVEGDVDADNNALVNFTASANGEYKVQVVIKSGDYYYSTVETITVGGAVNNFKDIVVVSLGANSMIVNNELVALDVAPFIENNRTMMQFNVLYVFGIDVEWVAETQSIVAEGNGIKVVMQLGSKVATVNGEEVTLDVAPYSVNGRTVVPVGFITGVLDITPTFTYNADGSIADILFTK